MAVNNGPNAAENVALAISPIPGDTELVSVTPGAGGSCLPGEVFCSFSGSTGIAQSRTITVVVRVDDEVSPDDLIEATAVVTSSSPDSNTSNNTATTTTRVGTPASADLSVAKSVSSSQAQPGSIVTFNLAVSNAGVGTAVNAVLTDSLPSALVFSSLTAAAGWSCTTPAVGAGGTVQCTRGSVSAGETATFELRAQVLLSASGTIQNSASISSPTADPGLGNNIASANVTIRAGACAAIPTRIVPVVLDVDNGVDHFTTELALTNRGTTQVALTLRYTASIGSGTGFASETLPAGRQLLIPDVLQYLRQKGLQIPPVTQGTQVGTLNVVFDGASDPNAVAATARTTAAVTLPQGAAGLAYVGLDPCHSLTSTAYLFGLRSTANDRTNLAVFNPTDQPVTLKISVISGDPLFRKTVVVRDALTLEAYGWNQVNRILDGTGISNGFASVELLTAGGAFGTYAVINNNFTGDGSFVLPVSGVFIGDSMIAPVVVETLGATPFRSEIIFSNRGATEADFTVNYTESLDGATKGQSGSFVESLSPGEQKIIPNAVDYLRDNGIPIGAEGSASYAGSVRIGVSGASLSEAYVGARTAARSGFVSGGEFGLFTPGVFPGEEAQTEAFLYGLQANANNRSNVAVLHAGASGSGTITLEIQVFDGNAAGAPKGVPEIITLGPGGWTQFTNLLKAKEVANGWVRVRRTAGTAGWVTYGVVNDGGNPGERTGDGAYVPMVK